MASEYKANSLTLSGAIAMGTGVMIGAGIFALTGQIAQLAGPLFPLSFVAGAIVTAFSAYRQSASRARKPWSTASARGSSGLTAAKRAASSLSRSFMSSRCSRL